MGHKVGACLGKVLEYDVYECKEKGSFLKNLVELDTKKPLLTRIPVGNRKDGVSWVEFSYEKLPQFCYNCGRIGHDDVMCKERVDPELNNDPENNLLAHG
ncbi:Zinc finger, CCHC-type [Sesbania bispinosa]|nr:Zinc finger, CCHC-type [Sesbania bispinosa]